MYGFYPAEFAAPPPILARICPVERLPESSKFASPRDQAQEFIGDVLTRQYAELTQAEQVEDAAPDTPYALSFPLPGRVFEGYAFRPATDLGDDLGQLATAEIGQASKDTIRFLGTLGITPQYGALLRMDHGNDRYEQAEKAARAVAARLTVHGLSDSQPNKSTMAERMRRTFHLEQKPQLLRVQLQLLNRP